MKASRIVFYLCPRCFDACESVRNCHGHRMIRCDVATPDDERRKPLIAPDGRLTTHAPRWFLEALGWQPVR